MTSISEWKKWILYNLIGEGIHNVLFDDQIRKLSGRHFEENLTTALNVLVDSGILLKLETSKRKKFIVNYERLNDAQKILNDNRNWKYHKEDDTNKNVVHKYFSEPEGYNFWFNLDDRLRKKKSIYNIYYRKTDDLDFSAQIITQKYSKILYMGSLRQNSSIISKLWNACLELSAENKNYIGFILQDIQDKERKACGNNRQRGKIALAIFKKLGYISENGRKGNSVTFTITGKSPPFTTLDSLLNK